MDASTAGMLRIHLSVTVDERDCNSRWRADQPDLMEMESTMEVRRVVKSKLDKVEGATLG